MYLPTSTARRIRPEDIAAEIEQPKFPELIQQFINKQPHSNDDLLSDEVFRIPRPTRFYGRIVIYSSALVTFLAPSDTSGIDVMRRERIRAVSSWRGGPGRYDTGFVNTDSSVDGMRRIAVARVQLFFTFSHNFDEYRCALVHWFSPVGDSPDEHTGMWVVQPDDDEYPPSVIHLDSIARAVHLLPVFGPGHVSRTLSSTDTPDTSMRFYVKEIC